MTQKNVNPWTFDVRVRERNLKSGAVNEKDLEKYYAGLADLADQAEPVSVPQPALAQPEAAVQQSVVHENKNEEERPSSPEEAAQTRDATAEGNSGPNE
ncbi:MAG: hypothetical protein FWD69_07325 [Polyangiaceae bacterium]|nr:hypothetical protein [Polyangiaceae bacterium]